MSGDTGTAMVVGASRGLGLATVKELLSRGWRVIATERGGEGTALSDLASKVEGRLRVESLDITDAASLAAIENILSGTMLDLLFVVAGIAKGPEDRVDRVSDDDFLRMMRTNALGPMRVISSLENVMQAGGMIAVMSSSLGSVSLNDRGTWEVYRASKAALNSLMRSYAARHAGVDRSLALVDPGYVKTDMGGSDATLRIEDSIPGIVDSLMARRGEAGLAFFNYKGETVPW